MINMEFKSIAEAYTELNSKYGNLWGVIDPISNKKNWALFVGVHNEIMSASIYQGVRGNFPEHTFTNDDLNRIEFWVGYFDESIIPLSLLLQDNYLLSLCEPDGLYHEVEIKEDWSTPIRIPKGLNFKMTFKYDKEIWYKIFDAKNSEKSKMEKMQREEGFCRLFRYDNVTEMHNMEEPTIIFKLNDSRESSGVSLLFVNE